MEYIVYKGIFYTIEWYYDAKKKSKVSKFFEDLTDQEQAKVLALFAMMANNGKINC